MDRTNELLLAIEAARAGRPAEARGRLRQVVAAEPHNAVAWFWLCDVSETLAEKIEALESALMISPNYPKGMARLQALYAEQDQAIVVKRAELLAQTREAQQAGRTEEARGWLLRLVEEVSENEQAWLMLSELTDEPADQMVALRKALQANPKNMRARWRLKLLQRFKDDLLTLGDVYRDEGLWAPARMTYLLAAARAPNALRRAEAKQRVQEVERWQELPSAARPQHTITILRLMLGPVLLYGVLIWLSGGLDVWQVPLFLYVAWIGVWIGSMFLAGLAAPRHEVWLFFFGIDGLSTLPARLVISVLGLAFVVFPYVLVMGVALRQLVQP